MAIRIKLAEDQVLLIRADSDEWARAYKNALDNNGMIEVHEGRRTLAINPRQILFWEEIPDADPLVEAELHQATRLRKPSPTRGWRALSSHLAQRRVKRHPAF